MWSATSALVLALLAAAPQQPCVVEIEACRVGLTPAGGTARFWATVIYEASINRDGSVAGLKALETYDYFNAFVEVEKFESCIKRWKFSGEGRTIVTFFAGTSGGAWKITVSSSGRTITLVL
jgi:hypothetical protein